ncbi:type II secretion system minor pseudopilin GspJ [Oceanicoccus sp. KOV_DT_Chl]|uniref:type II secretion system minor pseudopilin GspJ n=1 Tax=Oceanicoccus sp. KOV_DT_Chl TaxID=1904639 RepID=UPI000C7AA6AA|nr:type II secretion system minor pseudopilin GspJ [Oceanicoccus sp. KOV_DT_Chl]
MSLSRRHSGLTLLEVLIALSIFSMIGIASYQVLNSTIVGQQQGDVYSSVLGKHLKALSVMDYDLQQWVDRSIRLEGEQTLAALMVGDEEYPLQFTRGGQRNPLLMARSSLQRIAYDVGPHPQAENEQSVFYRDEKSYLRRHIWQAVDRMADATPRTQVLLADVVGLTVSVITEDGPQLEWPLPATEKKQVDGKPATKILAIQLSWQSDDDNTFSRLYPVL